jgi:hypothetical protein
MDLTFKSLNSLILQRQVLELKVIRDDQEVDKGESQEKMSEATTSDDIVGKVQSLGI